LIITYSSIKVFQQCPRKYYWRHVAAIDPAKPPLEFQLEEKVSVGKLFHEAIASGDDIPLKTGAHARARGMIEAYRTVWNNPNEFFPPGLVPITYRTERFEVQLAYFDTKLGVILAGVLDAIGELNGVPILIETKTTSSLTPEYWERWEADAQISMYVLLANQSQLDISTAVVDVVRRPGHRFNPDKEDLEGFAERIKNVMLADPLNYFGRHLVFRDAKQIAQFLNDLQSIVLMMKSCMDRAADHRHEAFPVGFALCTEHNRCPYKPLCLGLVSEAECERTSIFPELEFPLRLTLARSELPGGVGKWMEMLPEELKDHAIFDIQMELKEPKAR